MALNRKLLGCVSSKMQTKCMQTAYLISNLEQNCKSISQIHQVHAQTVIRSVISLCPTLIFTKILHALAFLPSQQTPISSSVSGYPAKIVTLLSNPSTFNYNCIIRAYVIFCSPCMAVDFFKKMKQQSIRPDFYSFPFVLKACAMLRKGTVSLAKSIHSQLLKHGFLADVFVCNALACAYCRVGCVERAREVFDESSFKDVVTYNVMIDGFAKSGKMEDARKVFDEMLERDSVSWGTLLAGYAKTNYCHDAIELFDRMVDSGVNFDNVALVSVLSACAQLGDLEKGKAIHDQIERNGIRIDSYLGTALVDMYAKCGCIGTAKEVFESCRVKNVSLWNAMLLGLAMHGNGESLLEYFSRMVTNHVRADGVTILSVLVGCSHSGLINDARKIFGEMESVYGVCRESKHYGCMIDLLGRCGLITEAVELIGEMPTREDEFAWGGVLGGCKIHGNLAMAEEAAKQLMVVKPEDGGVYSILAHMYANSQRWEDLVTVRRLRESRRWIKKSAGCSSIKLDGIRHEFVSGDFLHPYTHDIHSVLNGLELNPYV